ncbi:MAG TPA: rhodanese-like domain-containing protein [Thermodesulfobacteriota bacterium]|nr:rhodanese-like domain-containing protein [Thermodesulfobacteriota bacterium]
MNRNKVTLLVLTITILMFFPLLKEASSVTDNSESKTQAIQNITPEEAHVLIQKNKDNPDLVILDVRTPEEFAEGHIENALNLNYYSETFREDLNKLDKDKTYITHCRSGSRSGKTIDMMKELGFKEAYNMTGGFVGWEEKGFPTTK